MNIFKIKESEVNTLREWGKLLSTEKLSEATESLKLENCQREFCIVFNIEGEWYSAMHMEASRDKKIIAASQERTIDKEHIAILKKVIQQKIATDVVYDINLNN